MKIKIFEIQIKITSKYLKYYFKYFYLKYFSKYPTLSLNNQCVSSPLDVYELLSPPAAPNLHIATLNSRSVLNKSAIINNYLLETILTYCLFRKLGLMMVNFQIRYCLPYPIMFFRSFIAGLIQPVVVVLLLLTRNLIIILCIYSCYFHIRMN